MSIRTIGCRSFRVVIPTPAEPIALMGPGDPEKTTTEFEIHSVSDNSGPIYVGLSDVSAATHIPRLVNSTTAFTALDVDGEPKHFDLSDYYVVGTSGDVVIVQYRSIYG